MSDDGREREERPGGRGKGRRVRRQLAEWVSLGVSTALILALIVFLVHSGLTSARGSVVPEVKALPDRAEQHGGAWLLPVRVKNGGRQMLGDLGVELRYTPPGAPGPERVEATIDYLGKHSEQELYFYVPSDPRGMAIEARPLHYQVK
ncbi:hypothetical protein WME98_53265 [Sorangium sp. So ce296]|uniref:hypothetical protein n=1 Tax=Sorangium sp. So ce296 TaxID=3133296 RepID=UPI003F5F2AF0